MAEPVTDETAETTESEAVKTSRLKNFKLNHPRTAKVVGVIAVTAATFGAIAVMKGRKSDVETPEDDALVGTYDDSSETI